MAEPSNPSTSPDFAGEFRGELARAAGRGLARRLRFVEGVRAGRIVVDGRELLHFGSNDYLGLAADPRLVEAAARALAEWGVGATASPLVAGHRTPHRELEEALAAFKGAEAARVFPSGYAACVGVVTALAGPRDRILADALVHASLVDGARASRARLAFYRHRDLDHLADLLADDGARRGRTIVLTDGVFSMDGDVAPLAGLCDLADRHGALLIVDDAHGTGVMGPAGRGVVETAGLADRVPVRIGTLSKALGAQGGFVAGSRALGDLIVQRSRSLVYSTALAPAIAAAAREALRIVDAEPERRARLHENARRLRLGLAARGVNVGGDPAVPMAVVVAGSPESALAAADRLAEAGVFAPAVRPPTVPEGTSRIRLTPIAAHAPEDVDRVVAAFPAPEGAA